MSYIQKTMPQESGHPYTDMLMFVCWKSELHYQATRVFPGGEDGDRTRSCKTVHKKVMEVVGPHPPVSVR